MSVSDNVTKKAISAKITESQAKILSSMFFFIYSFLGGIVGYFMIVPPTTALLFKALGSVIIDVSFVVAVYLIYRIGRLKRILKFWRTQKKTFIELLKLSTTSVCEYEMEIDNFMEALDSRLAKDKDIVNW